MRAADWGGREREEEVRKACEGLANSKTCQGGAFFPFWGAVVPPPPFQDVALTGCSGCAARAQLSEEGEGVAEEGCTGRLGEDLAGARE